MARIGMNPAREATISYQAAPVTIGMLTYIPHLEGYFKDRLEVLQLSLRSLLNNTNVPNDLLVFDNGSCSEVIDTLIEYRNLGFIDYLFLSANNLGVQGGLDYLVKNAPGDFLAYTNDDVYFSQNWLMKHLEIFDAYPNVGMVSGAPVGFSSEEAISSLSLLLKEPPEGLRVSDRNRREEWELDWAKSTGRNLEEHLSMIAEAPQVLLEYQGVRAIGSAVHFQFVAPTGILKEALPEQENQLMGGMVELDHKVDQMGYLRLSTSERTTRHIGNYISGDLVNIAIEMDISTDKLTKKQNKTHWILYIPGAGRFLRLIYHWIFKILNQSN